MHNVDLPAAVIGFGGVHLALRAEADGIARLAESGAHGAARRRARLLAQVLAIHHHTEDTLLWPALEERHPGFALTTPELEDQHRRLDEELADLPGDVHLIEEVQPLLIAHLEAEEQRALPVWLASFSAEEHKRFGRMLQRSTPLADAGLMIAWLLDATPDAALPVARRHIPASLQAIHKLWWRGRYERQWGRMEQLALAS
jgi:hypothetical protein